MSTITTNGRFVEWNFVSSSRERIAQAKADWRAGRAESNAVQAPKFGAFGGRKTRPGSYGAPAPSSSSAVR